MGQVKVFGLKSNINAIKTKLSDIIHSCVVDALQYPEDKRFHRFFPLDKEDFYFSKDRTDNYTIIEISMFEGRTTEAKKKLINLLFERVQGELSIAPTDVEITIFETPKCNWGIRGLPGDELTLDYKVNV